MTRPIRILSASNGHGEDDIATKVLDALAEIAPGRIEVTAWPMVGQGRAYSARDIPVTGPPNLLPSEGFGTLSARLFWRDLRSGFIGTYVRQLIHAIRVRKSYDLVLATGDIVPLVAGWISRAPVAVISCAKSGYYDGKDGHTALDRWLIRRTAAVFPRDALTAERLAEAGVPAEDAGNPMMDGLEPEREGMLRGKDMVTLAMLAGSRQDATDNALILLEAGSTLAGADADPSRFRFLFAAHNTVDFQKLLARSAPGWDAVGWDTGLADEDLLCLTHVSGCQALFIKNRFAEVLNSSDIAVGMAGTANEQAIGLGLPLVNVPGQGNQGAAFVAMKMRYYGNAAVAASADPADIAKAIGDILTDPPRQRVMAAAGRERMGSAGASRAIAERILEIASAEGQA